jgi:hypothetical protein
MYDEKGAEGVRKAIETEHEHNLHERYIFNSKLQQDENIDEYVREFQKLAKTCKYGNLEGEIIKDKIFIGVSSNTIRRKLLAEKELTLQKAIDIAELERDDRETH